MRSSRHSFELLLLASLPTVATLLMLILVLLPKQGGLAWVMPLLPLAPIFYFGLMAPREMPYLVVALIGLVWDVASGLPLGLTSLLLLLFLRTLHLQLRYIHKEGFIVKWAYFALLLGVMVLLEWGMMAFWHGKSAGTLVAFTRWGMTVGIYPVLHIACDYLHRWMVRRRYILVHR